LFLKALFPLCSIALLLEEKKKKKNFEFSNNKKNMAAASSPMPVPGGPLGQGNQNGGTPTLGNKGAPTPMGRRRESRVRFLIMMEERTTLTNFRLF
jgi:hypothetical protein